MGLVIIRSKVKDYAAWRPSSTPANPTAPLRA